jgi:prepilin-type N-terminal cleavage/methylation domain-containing protein
MFPDPDIRYDKGERSMSRSNTKGFTLIEVIVAIAVVALLAGIITPSVIKHLDDSKRARAKNDALVIGAALASFYKDVGRWPTKDSAATYNLILLAGDGNTPTAAGGAANWALAIAAANADLMAYHLISNRPKNVAGNAYSVAGEQMWRGPYQPTLPADPWGNRYAVNIGNTAGANAVWILSAGPDGIVQTAFNQAIPNNGVLTTTGDDIGYRMK